MAPHLTETIYALGKGDELIARGSFDDYPPEVKELPSAGGYIDPDLEKITALNPALLILPGKHEEVTRYAELHHLPVLNVDMDSFASIDAGIETLGTALHAEAAAERLRKKLKDERAALRKAVAGLPRPKVLVITMRDSHDLNTLFTAGKPSFVSEVVELAGGDNIYADADQAYLEASKETVVMRAPEVILEFHAGQNLSAEDKADYIDDWDVLPTLPAVKSGRIYILTAAHALRPGPRIVDIARTIAGYLHPEADIPS